MEKTLKFKRLTLDLPPDIHKALKQKALDEGKTMKSLLMDYAKEITSEKAEEQTV